MPDANSPLKPDSYSFVIANSHLIDLVLDPQDQKKLTPDLTHRYQCVSVVMFSRYSFWFWPFWKSGWNVFDFVVVTIGILNMSKILGKA